MLMDLLMLKLISKARKWLIYLFLCIVLFIVSQRMQTDFFGHTLHFSVFYILIVGLKSATQGRLMPECMILVLYNQLEFHSILLSCCVYAVINISILDPPESDLVFSMLVKFMSVISLHSWNHLRPKSIQIKVFAIPEHFFCIQHGS